MTRLGRLVLLALVLVLGGTSCQGQKEEQSVKPYDLAISHGKYLTTFRESASQLQKVETRPLFKENIGIWQDRLLRLNENIYGGTHCSSDTLKRYLFKVDTKTLTGQLADVGGGDLYASACDGQYLYTSAVFGGHTDFYKYDQYLQEVTSQTIATEKRLCQTPDMVFVRDKLYVLVGNVDLTTSLHHNELWILSPQLELQEKKSLDYTAGGYFQMVAVEGKLYMTANKEGIRPDGEPDGGQHLLVYDLETGEMTRIETRLKYPRNIYYDEHHHKLLVLHDPLYVPDYTWTMIDLATLSQETLTFPELPAGCLEVFFTQTADTYYFLFDDCLVRYKVIDKQKVCYDLTPFAIHQADALLSCQK